MKVFRFHVVAARFAALFVFVSPLRLDVRTTFPSANLIYRFPRKCVRTVVPAIR